jgi:dicarboxylate transporter 10
VQIESGKGIMPALQKQVSAAEVLKSQDVKKKPIHYPFWFGGSASCAAACFTHPLDLGELWKCMGVVQD